jgi:hypothetical protein
MKTTVEPVAPGIVPKRKLIGKDGREAFADKIADAKKFLEEHPIPDHILKRGKRDS